MKQIYSVFKPKGLTPLEALERLREKLKLPKELKMTYAGRLDPLAEGVLILLFGNKLKEKDKFLGLNKTYSAQILFGASTDTFDLMGKVLKVDNVLPKIDAIKEELKRLLGKVMLPIPPYSSVPVNGRPSFMLARAGELNQKNLRFREMKINRISVGQIKTISAAAVLKSAQKSIAKVSGDFRQDEILKIWKRKLSGKKFKFLIVETVIHCGSGTYIRSIAHQLGNKLGRPALLYSLKRDRVGKFTSSNAISLKK